MLRAPRGTWFVDQLSLSRDIGGHQPDFTLEQISTDAVFCPRLMPIQKSCVRLLCQRLATPRQGLPSCATISRRVYLLIAPGTTSLGLRLLPDRATGNDPQARETTVNELRGPLAPSPERLGFASSYRLFMGEISLGDKGKHLDPVLHFGPRSLCRRAAFVVPLG